MKKELTCVLAPSVICSQDEITVGVVSSEEDAGGVTGSSEEEDGVVTSEDEDVSEEQVSLRMKQMLPRMKQAFLQR